MLKLEIEQKHDLAAHISAVLTHADVPSIVLSALVGALNELSSHREIMDTPAVVRAPLDYHRQQEDAAE
jgi:hypothetical protein